MRQMRNIPGGIRKKKTETLHQEAWVGIGNALKSPGCEISSHPKQKRSRESRWREGQKEKRLTETEQTTCSSGVWASNGPPCKQQLHLNLCWLNLAKIWVLKLLQNNVSRGQNFNMTDPVSLKAKHSKSKGCKSDERHQNASFYSSCLGECSKPKWGDAPDRLRETSPTFHQPSAWNFSVPLNQE